jgi:hypothetical protein
MPLPIDWEIAILIKLPAKALVRRHFRGAPLTGRQQIAIHRRLKRLPAAAKQEAD